LLTLLTLINTLDRFRENDRVVKRISNRLIFVVLVILCAGAIWCRMNPTACCIIAYLMTFRRARRKPHPQIQRSEISINDQ
jgi:hypothetical protein